MHSFIDENKNFLSFRDLINEAAIMILFKNDSYHINNEESSIEIKDLKESHSVIEYEINHGNFK